MTDEENQGGDLDMRRCRVPVDIIQHMVCDYARLKMELPEPKDGGTYGVRLEFVIEGRNPDGTPNAISARVAMHELPPGALVGKGGKA